MRPFLAAAALLLASTPAMAQQGSCAPLRQVFEELKKTFHEAPIWTGSLGADSGEVAILFQSSIGTWTLVQTNGQLGCIVGAGDSAGLLKQGPRI